MQMAEAGTQLVFCCMSTLARVRQAIQLRGEGDTPVIVIDATTGTGGLGEGTEIGLETLVEEEKTSDYPDPPAPQTVEEDELMLICWSSGTTGRPKGILHGPKVFFNLLENKDTCLHRPLQTTCMFHLGGFTLPLLSLAKGTEHIFIAGEDLDDDIRVILTVAEECKPDHVICGSHHLIQLASVELLADQRPASSVKMLLPLGTSLYHGILGDLKPVFPSAFGMLNIYGQSEAGGAISLSFNQRHLGGAHEGPIRVVDIETGDALGPGKVPAKHINITFVSTSMLL